jgi:hypothetical protein
MAGVVSIGDNSAYANAMAERYQMGNNALNTRSNVYQGGIAVAAGIGAAIGTLLLLASYRVSKQKKVLRETVTGTASNVACSPQTVTNAGNPPTSSTVFNCTYDVQYTVNSIAYKVSLSQYSRSSAVGNGDRVYLQYDVGAENAAYLCCRLSQTVEVDALLFIGALMIAASATAYTFRSTATTLIMGENVRLT